jgi:N-acetylglucosamine-6-sulfatase
LIVRYDPITGQEPTTDTHLIVNTDLAPTWAALAGVDAPNVDGMSFLPLLDGSATSWRSDFLLEHLFETLSHPVPTYCGVRNTRYVYVEYSTGEEELYDLSADPFELNNLAGSQDPQDMQIRSAMHSRLLELCSPPPPGFTP